MSNRHLTQMKCKETMMMVGTKKTLLVPMVRMKNGVWKMQNEFHSLNIHLYD